MNALIPLDKLQDAANAKGPEFAAEFNKRCLADVTANWNDIQDGTAEDSVIRKNRILAEMEAEVAVKKAA